MEKIISNNCYSENFEKTCLIVNSLSPIVFINCNFKNCIIRNSLIENPKFINCTFSHTVFFNINIKYSIFISCKFEWINFLYSTLEFNKFYDTKFNFINIIKCKLESPEIYTVNNNINDIFSVFSFCNDISNLKIYKNGDNAISITNLISINDYFSITDKYSVDTDFVYPKIDQSRFINGVYSINMSDYIHINNEFFDKIYSKCNLLGFKIKILNLQYELFTNRLIDDMFSIFNDYKYDFNKLKLDKNEDLNNHYIGVEGFFENNNDNKGNIDKYLEEMLYGKERISDNKFWSDRVSY